MNSKSVLLLLGAIALTGCGKSKIDQCNAFIDRANQAQTVVSGLDPDAEGSKIKEQIGKLEEEAKAVEGVQLEDQTLAGFRTTFAEVLRNLGKTLGDAEALKKTAEDPAKAAEIETQMKKLEADVETLGKQEEALVDSINKYCGGS